MRAVKHFFISGNIKASFMISSFLFKSARLSRVAASSTVCQLPTFVPVARHMKMGMDNSSILMNKVTEKCKRLKNRQNREVDFCRLEHKNADFSEPKSKQSSVRKFKILNNGS